MWKVRAGVLALVCAGSLSVGGSAFAAAGGDSNAGDVWTDNVGQPAGPGHEMDPHLACTDINLWGAGLADSSGSFTIDGWQPSGSQEVDYTGTWAYNTAQGGDQVIAVIDVAKLISTAQANGDAPKNKNGFHFKLDFSQDPQKHKTFWVSCTTAPAGAPAPGSTAPSSGTPAPSSGTPAPAGTAPAAGPAPTTPAPVTSTNPVRRSVSSVNVRARHRARRRHATLVRPRRHFHAVRRSVRSSAVAAPAFTG